MPNSKNQKRVSKPPLLTKEQKEIKSLLVKIEELEEVSKVQNDHIASLTSSQEQAIKSSNSTVKRSEERIKLLESIVQQKDLEIEKLRNITSPKKFDACKLCKRVCPISPSRNFSDGDIRRFGCFHAIELELAYMKRLEKLKIFIGSNQFIWSKVKTEKVADREKWLIYLQTHIQTYCN